MEWTNNYFDKNSNYIDLTDKQSFGRAYQYARQNGLPYFKYKGKTYAAIAKGETGNWEQQLIKKVLNPEGTTKQQDYKLSKDANPFLNMTENQVNDILGLLDGYTLNRGLFTWDGDKITGYTEGVNDYNLYNKPDKSDAEVNPNNPTVDAAAVNLNTPQSTTTTNPSFISFNSYSTNSGKLGESFSNNYKKDQLSDMYKHAQEFSRNHTKFNNLWNRLGGSWNWNTNYTLGNGQTNPFAIRHTRYTQGLEGLRSLIFMDDDALKEMGLENGSADLNPLFQYILNNTEGGKNLNIEMHDWIKRMNKENNKRLKEYIKRGDNSFTDYSWILLNKNGGIIINKWFGYKIRFNN